MQLASEEYVLRHLRSVTSQPHVVDLLIPQDMDLSHVAPAEEKIDEAKDMLFCENNAEFNKNCSKNLSQVDCSSLECCRAQEHERPENPSLTSDFRTDSQFGKTAGSINRHITTPQATIKITFTLIMKHAQNIFRTFCF